MPFAKPLNWAKVPVKKAVTFSSNLRLSFYLLK